MYLEEVLEVALGLVMMWLFVSIAVMQLQEWTASILGMRAKDLEMAISQLLTEEQAQVFYQHPLVQGLYKSSASAWKRAWLKVVNALRRLMRRPPLEAKVRPSYIPSDRFAKTVLDIVLFAGTPLSPVQQALAGLEEAAKGSGDASLEADWQALWTMTQSLLAQPAVSQRAMDSLRASVAAFCRQYGAEHPEFCPPLENALQQAQTTLADWSDEALRDPQQVLQTLESGVRVLAQRSPSFANSMQAILRDVQRYAADTEDKIAATRAAVENWFNDAMDRLSGWYKRKMQLLAFLFGLALAVFLNIDSLHIAQYLWREPMVRQMLASYASTYAENAAAAPDAEVMPPSDTVQTLQDELSGLQIPIGWQLDAIDAGGKICSPISFGSERIFGWPGLDENGQPICARITNLPRSTDEWMMKVIGLIVTGAAAAQGAPFWFDILKRLVQVRGAGVKPEEKKT